MTAPIRKTGLSASVFTLGLTNFLADLENVTLTIEVKDEDAAGIADQWEYAWAVKEKWQMECDIFVVATAAGMLIAGTSVAVSFTSGDTIYNGQALVTNGVHTINRDSLQKQRIVLKGQGAVTMT